MINLKKYILIGILTLITIFILTPRNLKHKIDLASKKYKVESDIKKYETAHTIIQKYYKNFNSRSIGIENTLWINERQLDSLLTSDSTSQIKYVVDLLDDQQKKFAFGLIRSYENRVTLFKFEQKDKIFSANEYYIGIGSKLDIDEYVNNVEYPLAIIRIDTNKILMKSKHIYLW